jgi:hypothetical protein
MKPTHKSFSKIGCKTLVDTAETRGYAHPPKEAYPTILHFNGFRSSTLKGAHLLIDKQFGDYSLTRLPINSQKFVMKSLGSYDNGQKFPNKSGFMRKLRNFSPYSFSKVL